MSVRVLRFPDGEPIAVPIRRSRPARNQITPFMRLAQQVERCDYSGASVSVFTQLMNSNLQEERRQR